MSERGTEEGAAVTEKDISSGAADVEEDVVGVAAWVKVVIAGTAAGAEGGAEEDDVMEGVVGAHEVGVEVVVVVSPMRLCAEWLKVGADV